MEDRLSNDEEKYSLSEQGEAFVVEELMGGQDVANVVAAFMQIIKTRGNVISEEGYEPTIKNYFEFAQITHIIKHCEDWYHLVKASEKLLEEETKYFESHPHANIVQQGGK